ncbi:MAG: RagB/SusD family nutrient uptake outer membrane protein [Draconibacterium sp.]
MKATTILYILVLLFCLTTVSAQQGINYKAMINDNDGSTLANTAVTIRFTILENGATAVYQESHDTGTDANGILIVNIGEGSVLSGDFNTINWGVNLHFLKTEIDKGEGFIDMGTTEFKSVPYALHAQTVEKDFNFIITGISDVSINKRDSVSLPVYIHWIDGEQESVALNVNNVPEGVSIEFENDSVTPNQGTSITIAVAPDTEVGIYSLSFAGKAENGKTKTYPINLKINTVLSAELEILDATTWSLENPALDLAPGATVNIFASQAALETNTPDYTAVSDENGIAQFYDIPGGEESYYFTVEKGGLSNTVNGYVIAGVFQDQQDINNSPWQSITYVGGLKYADLNGDGVITTEDTVMAQSMHIYPDEVRNLTVYIGEEDTTVQSLYIETESALADSLNVAIGDFHDFVEFSNLFDVVYTQNIAAPSSGWNDIYNHTANAESKKVNQLWFDGFTLIHFLNMITASAERLDLAYEQYQHYSATCKQIRASVYFTLLNWFGGLDGLPIYSNVGEENYPRSATTSVFNFMINDLQEANANLLGSGENTDVTQGFALAQLSLVELAEMTASNWPESYNYSNQVINSGYYSLAVPDSIYKQSSTETIYGFAKSTGSEFFAAFTVGDFVPVSRLTEMFLAAATATLEMGDLTAATGYLDQLRVRAGLPPLLGGITTKEELREEIYQQWRSEFTLEGNTFRVMKFFDKAISELGLDPMKLVLPIPLQEIINNPNITQNPGY